MSIEDIFDEFVEEKKKDKTIPEEASEPTKEPEDEGVSVPEGGEESKEEAEEKATTPSEEEDSVDWFEDTVEKPVDDQPIEEDSVDEKAEETPVEEAPAIATPAVFDDDWFETAEEEPASDKTTEDKPVEEEVAVDTPAEETPTAETPAEVTEDWFEPAAEEWIPAETPSETGVDRGALIRVKSSPIVVPAVSADTMRQQMALFQSLKASLLDKTKDIVSVQGKPYVKRSGWRKLALAFNLSDEIVKEQKEEKGDDFEWRHWVRAWAPNGRSVVGIGACSSKERDFAHLEHDVYAVSHTRAKNRALSDLIGSGEVSWEELRGFN